MAKRLSKRVQDDLSRKAGMDAHHTVERTANLAEDPYDKAVITMTAAAALIGAAVVHWRDVYGCDYEAGVKAAVEVIRDIALGRGDPTDRVH
jgi:hypothetical protein